MPARNYTTMKTIMSLNGYDLIHDILEEDDECIKDWYEIRKDGEVVHLVRGFTYGDHEPLFVLIENQPCWVESVYQYFEVWVRNQLDS